MKKFYITLVTFLFLAVANAQIVNIPDPVFKARLLAAGLSLGNQIASTQTPNLNGNVSSYTVIDTNGDGEIQLSEASVIKLIRLEHATISNFEGINSFVNLQSFFCTNNQLTSLDVSGLTNLVSLYCSQNLLPNLVLDGLTNLKRLNCANNQISSLDLSSLANLDGINCSNNQLLNINMSGLTNLTSLACGGNQLTNLNISGLTNLKGLYCASNELTNLIFGNFINFEQLVCANNQITSLDLSGLPKLNYLECQNNQLISLNIKNGNALAWESLYFINNPNISYICADQDDISYYVQERINQYGYATTCHVNSYCTFTPGGTFYIVQGNSRVDINNDGCDNNDLIFPNLKYNITNGTVSGSYLSNSSGNYSFPVQAGSHMITPVLENLNYYSFSPAYTIVPFPTVASPAIRNFCIVPNGVHHDLEVVVIPVNVARPGFDAKYKIKYKNKGTTSENTTINFNYNDAILDYVSSSVAPTTQATGTCSWNVGTIAPFQTGEFIVTLNVNSPMETPAVNGGDVLSYTATANGLNTDETPDDNTFTLPQVVVNSFDPNDKTCLEGAIINPNTIGKYVHYKIRFENTGTFAAQNIVVKDMIDITKFDVSTLQMTDASHSCVTRITNPNKVEFIFENINLPFDDANNDGYVVFKIKTKPTLVVGNTISNSANIYFDYNFPIVTNTATSTFSVLQNDTFEFDNYFTIYPNPVDEVLNLTTKQETEIYSLTIYNLLGQQVQTTTNPTNTVDVSSLKTGNYIVKVVTDKGVSSSKFVKE